MNLTDEQARTIRSDGRTLLVSASAGTGKTTVLTAHIMNLLTSGERRVPLSRMLIVTFTEAAAAEMRRRIGEALLREVERRSDDTLLREDLDVLPKADILTFHAFGDRLIRSHGALLGVDPDARLLDESERSLLEEEILDGLLGPASRLGRPTAVFGGKGDRNIRGAIRAAAAYARTLPEPEAWLDRAVEVAETRPGQEEIWRRAVTAKAREALRAVALVRDSVQRSETLGLDVYTPHLERWAGEIEAWAAALGRGEILPCPKWGTLPTVRDAGDAAKAAAKRPFERAKAHVRDIDRWISYWGDETVRRSEGRRLVRTLRPFVGAVRAFLDAYEGAKRRDGRIDYDDQAALAYRLLLGIGVGPEVGLGIRERYDAILVDEFQDVNPLQERLVDALAEGADRKGKRTPLFLVGDVKQSIYGFRHAAPDLFMARHRRYAASGSEGPLCLPLQGNFRSTPTILSAVNRVFERAMNGPAVVYGEDSRLEAGRDAETFKGLLQTVPLILVPKAGSEADEAFEDDDEAELSAAEREADVIASEIDSLVGNGLPVWDRATGARRPVGYGDIAVLMRGPGPVAASYLERFRGWGVPAHIGRRKGYYDSLEFLTLKGLLGAIFLPERDHDLAIALRGPWWGLHLREITEAFLSRGKGSLWDGVVTLSGRDDELGRRFSAVCQDLVAWRRDVLTRPLGSAVADLLEKTRLRDHLSGLPDAQRALADVETFLYLARTAEGRGEGLGEFLETFEVLAERRRDVDEPAGTADGGGAVRIMSIHQSKGLEFPVVFLAQLGRRLSIGPKEHLALDRSLGMALPSVHMPSGATYRSPHYVAIQDEERQRGLEEELRLVYVGMTRARDALYLVGSVAARREEVEAAWRDASRHTLPPGGALEADTALDWLGPVAMTGGPIEIRWASMKGRAESGRTDFGTVIREARPDPGGVEAYRALHDEDEPAPGGAPQRITATDLAGGGILSRRLSSPEGFPHPDVAPPAQIGNLTHAFMEGLDLSLSVSQEGLACQRDAMVSSGRLPREALSAVDTESLAAFFAGEWGERILRARQVMRELPFSMLVDPAGRSGGEVLLQGKVDLLVVQGDGAFVVDFKTDKVTSPEAQGRAEAYTGQLWAYRRAVEVITGLPCRSVVLYFTVPRTVILDPDLLASGKAGGTDAPRA